MHSTSKKIMVFCGQDRSRSLHKKAFIFKAPRAYLYISFIKYSCINIESSLISKGDKYLLNSYFCHIRFLYFAGVLNQPQRELKHEQAEGFAHQE